MTVIFSSTLRATWSAHYFFELARTGEAPGLKQVAVFMPGSEYGFAGGDKECLHRKILPVSFWIIAAF